MFDVELDDSRVNAWLDRMPAKMRQSLEKKVSVLTQMLRSYITTQKLLGQVLKRKTDALGQHVQERVESTNQGVTGVVYVAAGVPYGRIHEYGAVFAREVVMAWGKKMKNPRSVTFHYPERSYMRSSLKDKTQEIVDGLKEAIKEGTQP